MAVTDQRAAELCNALYLLNPFDKRAPFYLFDAGLDDGICWAVAREPDADVIVLRGSITPQDWFRDVMADPYMSRRMGRVHRGFYLGLDNAWRDLAPMLRADMPIVVTGHSLGAGRAALLTGIMIDAGRPPAARIVFGEPKPGFADLAAFIAGVPARSYRNGVDDAHDVVTDLPFTIPALGLDYVHPTPLTFVSAPPAVDDGSVFAWHHMPLYLAALSPNP